MLLFLGEEGNNERSTLPLNGGPGNISPTLCFSYSSLYFSEACAVGREMGRVKRRVKDVHEGREHKVTIEAFISEK